MTRRILSIPTLLLLLVPACAGPAPSEPEKFAATLLLRNDPLAIRDRFERLGAAIGPEYLPGWPGRELAVRGECSGATPLRLWFESRGLFTMYAMEDVLRRGVLGMISGRPPDWEALTAAAVEAEHPQVPLPCLPEVVGFWYDEGRHFRLVVVRSGAIWFRHAPVAGEALRATILEQADRHRDETDPETPSEVFLEVAADRSAPFGVLRPVLEACRDPAVRIRKLVLVYFAGDEDYHHLLPVYIMAGHPPVDTRSIRVSGGASPTPPGETLLAALGDGGQENRPVRLRIDDDAAVQRVAEVLYAICGASAWPQAYLEDGGEPEGGDRRPAVTVDGVPVGPPASPGR
jgi:hypothetical protein